MANKRNLKKEINFIAEELIASCLLSSAFMQGNNDEEINELVGKVLDLQVEFLSRVNHPNGTKERKLIKNYYNALIADFDKNVDEILNKLEALNK